MKQIALTGKRGKGKFVLVDDEWYPILYLFNWHENLGYASRSIYYYPKNKTRIQKRLMMHAIIANTPKGFNTDHINGNRLDNRRCNLRICTNSQNQANRGIPKDNVTGYKGIWFDPKRKRWFVHIKVNGKNKSIGRFLTKEEAAFAYNEYALRYFGSFAKLNTLPSSISLKERSEKATITERVNE